MNMEWIDVNERLPEDGEKMLVLLNNGMELTGARYFSETKNWTVYPKPHYNNGKVAGLGNFSWYKDAVVTHWCPIPPPPPPKPHRDTATKPVVKDKNGYDIHCPNCDEDLNVCCCGRDCQMEHNFTYCPYCRQKLDWESEGVK